MKKQLLAIVIASAISPASFSDVLVYGKANVTFQSTEKSNDNYTEVVSNASRIGLKGEELINDGLKAIYQFEYQTKIDDGANAQTCTATSTNSSPDVKTQTSCSVSGQTFAQRNIYVGLQGSAGTITAGMFDTPLKASQEKIDLFNDLVGDLAEVLEGDIRAKNIIQYTSPSFSNISLNAAYINSEQDVKNAVDGYSISAAYNTKSLYFSLAADHNAKLASEKKPSSVDVDIIRAVTRINIGKLTLGAMYEIYDNGVTDDEDGYLLSAQYNLDDKWSLKAQTSRSDMKVIGAESTSFGVDYKLSKSTKLFGFHTLIKDDLSRDENYSAIGIELNF